MSLQHLAEQVRAKGRHGDTELMHVTKGELGGLNSLARAMYGHDLPNNPYTGLPEASFLKSILPTLAGAAVTYFTGSSAAGAAAGAAVGGYQAKRAGGDFMTGALAGGMGGYGGGQLTTGLNAAGAGAGPSAGAGTMPAGAAEAAAAGDASAVAPPTSTPPPTAAAGGKPAFSWDNMKRGIGALGTEEGRTTFTGTAAEKGKPATGAGGSPYAALLAAAAPVIVDSSSTGTKAGKAPPEITPQKYEGHWGRDEAGRWVWQSKNVTPEKHAEGGEVADDRLTSQNVFDYLMGEDQLHKAKYMQHVASGAGEDKPTTVGVGVPDDAGAPGAGGPITNIGGGGPGADGGGGGSGASQGDTGAPTGVSTNVGQAVGAAIGTAIGIGPSIGAAIGSGIAGMSQDAAANAPNAAPNSPTAGVAVAADDAAAAAAAPSGVAPVSPEAQAAIEGMISADAAASSAPSSSVGVGAAPGTPGGIGAVGGDGSEGGSSAGDSSGADGGVGSADGTAYDRGGLVALQSGGFVFPADVVAAVGAGSSSAGLEALAKKFGARPVAGKGHGQSDSIPAAIDGQRKARVARDEAVLDAAQVARIGGGDGKKGAQKLYDMMARVRKQSMGRNKQMRPVNLKGLV